MPRVTNEQIFAELKEIRAYLPNGEIRRLREILPQLETVAQLSADVPALHRVAVHVETLVEGAVMAEDAATTRRTLGRWTRIPRRALLGLWTMAAGGLLAGIGYWLVVIVLAHH